MRAILLLLPLLLTSCGSKPDVVLYCATDQETAREIVALAEKVTGLKIRARYDTEANKTVGLVNALLSESESPRCDVWWNNEVVHTARLAKRGLLASYDSPSAQDVPRQFRGPSHQWTGFSARARVLIVNTKLLPEERKSQRPNSMWDLTAAPWKARGAIAKPVTGTTLTHVAALFATFGEKEGMRFLDGLKANEAGIVASNGASMRQVSEGRFAFGFTDTDDFNVALRVKKFPVAVVYPDQGPEGVGTLVIPNTLALIKGGPNPENGKKLIDFLLSHEVEKQLAFSRMAQIPVRDAVERPEWVGRIGEIKTIDWDPQKTGEWMDQNMKLLRERNW